MLRSLCLAIYLFVMSLPVRAGEGMWLPLLLSSLNEAEMQALGMKMTAEDIYSINKGSLKDAIVHFGGFCTGEIISSQGLVLTNHHCGYSAIQSHSTVENNLLTSGFWAKTREEELPNPGLYVTFIVRIEDVTEAALTGVHSEMSPAERQSLTDQNLDAARTAAQKEAWQDVMVRSFFEGNQYFLFVTETYRDVRLVGAPPESIGKFGADTDNWEWPRHTGDFSIFRVYAGPDNRPAEYSPENVPMKPRHSLPISLSGVKEGDFTLVFGFPGSTAQYLTSHAVQQVIDVVDPARIGIREISLQVMDRAMRKDEATRLKFAPRFASLSNGYKKWIGERQGLIQVNAVGQKQKYEAEFVDRLSKDKMLQEKYGELLPKFGSLYAQTNALEKARIYYQEIFGVNIRLFQLISRLDRLKRIYDNNGEEAFQQALAQQKGWLHNFYENFDLQIDKETCAALLEHLSSTLDAHFLPEELQKEWQFMRGRSLDFNKLSELLYSSAITDPELPEALSALDGPAFSEKLSAEPAYTLYKAAQEVSDTKIAPLYNAYAAEIDDLRRKWMTALMDVFPERRFWPDANSTLRVTYGQVEGYHPRDAVVYEPVTYLDGVMEKYKPGDYEFDVHPKLIELYEAQDYGRYADPATGVVPVCFLGSNHTTGGNSGSPAIDASGNLIGLNFDRVWEGTMSDIYYDRSICRNIMVDIRYVLFIVDKFAGAGHLIEEMEIVGE